MRLTDNTGLIDVLKKYDKVLPVFIYDHNQFGSSHCSKRFLEFQEGALQDLNLYLEQKESRLCKFYGTPHKVLNYLMAEYKPAAVAFNLDYSYYSIERDKLLISAAETAGIKCHVYHDVMLNFDHPFNKAFHIFRGNIKDVKVQNNRRNNYDNRKFLLEKGVKEKIKTISRKDGIKRIKGTAPHGISCHMKLGLLSSREVYVYGLKNSEYLSKQMIWREFFFASWLAHKNNYDFYDERFKKIIWKNDTEEMKALWTGKTGFELIDAGVKQLNTTGFMDNRSRLLVGFFSIKILHINPFLVGENWNCGGQLYFSRNLIDCCYANNTGNWHWIASDELDASGMRFNKGFAGRPFNVGNGKKKIVDEKIRYAEWIKMTQAV